MLDKWSQFSQLIKEAIEAPAIASPLESTNSFKEVSPDNIESLIAASEAMKTAVSEISSRLNDQESSTPIIEGSFYHDILTSVHVVVTGLYILELQCRRSGPTSAHLLVVIEEVMVSCCALTKNILERQHLVVPLF